MLASWRALVIRLGERCQEYGGDTDPVEHLVSLRGTRGRCENRVKFLASLAHPRPSATCAMQAACVSILKRHLAVDETRIEVVAVSPSLGGW